MSQSSIKNKTIKGSMWSLIDNFSSQGFTFIIGIILARLLSPTDYGTIGVLAIFISIANVFVECGFGNALIRKKDRTQADLSTAFYFNLVVGFVIYGILYLIAPFVADFFKMPILVDLLRVLAFCIVFHSMAVVQNAVLTAELNIKSLTIVNISTQIPMGCVGIYFAYKGFGVWTLVIQQVGSAFLKMVWLWIISRWRPSAIFSRDSFMYLYNFGWKLLGTNLLGTFFNDIYGFIIGRYLGARELGFYTKSKQLSEYPKKIIASIVNRVVLPFMVETQGDTSQIRDVYSRLMQLMSFVVFPIFGILIVIAKPLILTLWTEKWVDSVLLFQMFCVGVAFGPFSTLNFCLLQLLNRTDVMLKLEFIKKPICFGMLIASIPWGLTGIVLFASLYNIIGSIINAQPTRKLILYSYKGQINDILMYLIVIIFSAVIGYLCMLTTNILFLQILIGSTVTGTIYILCCYKVELKGYYDFVNIIKTQIIKRK